MIGGNVEWDVMVINKVFCKIENGSVGRSFVGSESKFIFGI